MAAHLRSLFQRLGVDCVFDVGANIGQYATFLRSMVGFKGLIVSVEPVAAFAEHLRSLASGDELWLVENAALGASAGQLRINVARSGEFSSFLPPKARDVAGFAEQSGTLRTEEVRVRTFDDLLSSIRRTHRARRVYLKLDTQGFDLEALKGVHDAAPIVALQSEMSIIPLYESMPDYLTALRAFSERGFSPSAMFPVAQTRDGRLIEFDCVMLASPQDRRASGLT